MTLQDQQYALIYYLENYSPGPVLRQIAEERIRWLEEAKYKVVFKEKERKGATLPIPCVNKSTGAHYPSISRAALMNGISKDALLKDIQSRNYRYNIIPLDKK